jgi:1-acyl-sn-glycerol-3-phosphate acyltransferase
MNRLGLIGFNVVFYILLVLFTSAAVPLFALFLVGVAVFFPRRVVLRRLRRCISWYGWVVIRILPFRFVRIRYRDLAPSPSPGPHIFVCNHRSSSDPFLMALLPHECIQIVNTWPFRLPVWGVVARLAGYLSIAEMPAEEFLETGSRLLEQGCCVIAFPEGTRARTREIGPFHGSVFRLALQARASIVPIGISGNERIPARGCAMLHPGLIRVHRLPALMWNDYKDLSAFQLKNRVRELIVREVAAMDGES